MWKLQGGSYIPGFSGQAFGAGLQRDVTKTRKDQAKKARALEKYMSKRGTLGKWAGNIVGAGVGLGLGAMGMGPLGLTIGKTLGAGLGSRLGSSKMISGEGPSMAPGAGTGLLGSTYEQLGEAKGGIDEAMRGQAYGAGASQLVSGMTGVAGDKLGAQLGDMFGKWKAGRTGLSGYEPTGIGNAFGLDMAGTRTPFGGAGNTLLPGYGGFSMSPKGLQSGGALGKTFGLSKPSFNTYDPDKTKSWMSMVDKISGDTDARRKALAELGGMEHAESAKESEDIYQKSLPIREETLKGISSSALSDLSSGITGAKDASSAMQNYLEGQKFFRQQDPSDTPYGEPMEPMMNPFTGESLGELSVEDVPFDYLRDLRQGKSKNPYEDIVSGLEYGTRQPEQSLMDRLLGRGQQTEISDEYRQQQLQKFGMQQGGMMPGGVSNALPYQEGGDVEGYPEGGWEEKFKSNLKNPSWEEYGMGEYATREKPGRYQDPIHKYLSDMILSGRQDTLGGLLDDDYYKPLVEQELKFMNLQKRAQSAEDAIPSYSGKKEGIDLGDIFGEQSWLKQRGKKKSISDYKYALGETILGQRINELYNNNLYGLGNNTEDYQDDNWLQKISGRQQGGSISPYNLGGSVTQQPMAYQLGGLLKYKRSPMMG
jgi:hypothetical protein